MKLEAASFTNERLAKVGMYLIAALPVLILYLLYSVRLKYFVFGSGSWAVGVLLKMAVYHLVIRRVARGFPRSNAAAIMNGLSSGLCELGAAMAAFLYLGKMSIPQIISFGVGIGSFEAWLVASIPDLLKGTGLEAGVKKLEHLIKGLEPSQRRLYELYLPVLERLLAGMVHVGTRTMVYVSFITQELLPAVGSLAIFVLIDGWLAFRLLMSPEPSLHQLRQLYVWMAALATISARGGIDPALAAAVDRRHAHADTSLNVWSSSQLVRIRQPRKHPHPDQRHDNRSQSSDNH